ncbi:hypothetical protein OG871_17370 [Kitasatospora sp. NBC_00374]|uniref:LppU/SCO3897 family protein n=1 Tax=Kitasatospora sp. NBC_00374 TaxID=2975964 RepID=UPI0032557DC8
MTTPPTPEAQDQAAYPQDPAAVAEPPKKRRAGKILLGLLGAVVVLVAAVVAIGFAVKDDPSIAEVGNCVHNAGSDTKPNVSIVDCGAANADFKVLKVVQGKDDKECEAVEGFEAAYSEESSSDSFILCLGKNSH